MDTNEPEHFPIPAKPRPNGRETAYPGLCREPGSVGVRVRPVVMLEKRLRKIGLLIGVVASVVCVRAAETTTRAEQLFAEDNLVAWCIVPFDAEQRGPRERVQMLARLGFTQYAWDWREEHLATWPEEISLARAHGIKLAAVWLWIEEGKDEPGRLSAGNLTVINAINEAGLAVDYWIGFHENYFANLDHDERVAKGAAMVAHLNTLAADSDSTVSLYNHGGWFGESENQLEIIERVNDPRAGMVYNFHHAHHEIEQWPENLARMLPYLRAVNLNGMKPAGPKIVPLGQGTHELDMLRVLLESGYDGPVGILGHVDTADVETILRQNLDGLKVLTGRL